MSVGGAARGTAEGGPKGTKAPKGYLIWDRGFGRRFLASLGVLGGLALAVARSPWAYGVVWAMYQDVLFQLMDGAHRMAWWSVIGLLSSSCCALQLMLNLLNFGCAGFNTALGPFRPFLCALTVFLQAAVWSVATTGKPFQWQYKAACTLLAAFLTFLPELLALRVQRGVVGRGKDAAVEMSRVVVALEGMGCAACTKKVAEVLDGVPEVVRREISLEDKNATVWFSVDAGAASALLPGMSAQLTKVGFPATPGPVGPAGPGEGPKKGAAAAAGLAGLGAAGQEPPGSLGRGGLLFSIGSGLASSSCCLLQLGVNLLASMNMVHVGCAGFNKVLGPWRFQLRLATGAWLLASWGLCLGRRWPRIHARRLLIRTLVCLSLMFLPEVLLWMGGPALAPATEGAEVLEVSVDGMGCEACQVHVQGVMDRMGGVVSSHVDFKSGRAEVVVNKGWNFDFAALRATLEADGYNASLRGEL